MNVSAKDKSTGKANTVTIKSSGGLSDNDIDRMVKEAEAARETDKKRRDLINCLNSALTWLNCFIAWVQLCLHSSSTVVGT